MYPATIFEFVDQSQIQEVPAIENAIVRPLYMCGFTSDKGPEDYKVVEGKEFFTLYGDDISFARHGQALLQTAAIINAGGKVFAKRVVAEDSTLANIAIVAEVSTSQVQKTNASGAPLYTDATTHQETTTATGNTAIMITKCNIKYVAKTASAAKTVNEASMTIRAALKGETPVAGTKVYPLFCIGDTGRGLSRKKIQIQSDYVSSKSMDYTVHTIKILEGNYTLETLQFALDPDRTDFGKNVSLEAIVKANSSQIKCIQYEQDINDFIAYLATTAGITLEDAESIDYLFGTTKKGEALPNIVVDPTGINLSNPYGQAMASGTNGAFGNVPTAAESYDNELAKVWSGEFSDCIYDLDNYKIDVVVDANYPATVKRAIEQFVTFREDCMYFRDLGIGPNSVESISFANKEGLKNKFCATYCTTYDIIDPYSKKQVTVTVGYNIAKLLVSHFAGGRSRPLAGVLNNFVITDAIKGTVNFIPVVTPSVNQKDTMEDLRINYASYFDDKLVVESLYTSQEKLTQFSYVNNILAIQEVIKAVRAQCPKIRYSFIDGQDLEGYQKDVQKVLDRYTPNFLSMTIEYIADAVYISNKIFYAAIKVQFRNFVQTEYFKVIAIPS